MTGAAVPPTVAEVCGTFLAAADTAAPGLVTGLYLVGSVALGDFHQTGADFIEVPGGPPMHTASDIDFVAVLSAPADGALAALKSAHRTVRQRYPRHSFEGTHLTAGELASGPDGVDAAPYANHGGFLADARFAINPVTWHELAAVGIAVRGPAVADLAVWTDDAVFRAFTVDNLTSYWRAQHTRYHGAIERIAANPRVAEWVAQWCVLGISRLHKELADGGLATKCAGGGNALATFDARWHPLVVDTLGIRAGHPSRYGEPASLVRDAVDFLEMAIDSASALGSTAATAQP